MVWLLSTALAAAPPAEYRARVVDLRGRQVQLAGAWKSASEEDRAAVLESARNTLYIAIVDDLLPAWQDTPWDFYGSTETPGQGTIACGFYVSTILRDAGFKVDRLALGRQASENIIRTLVPRSAMWWKHGVTAQASVAQAEDGLYIAGLDQHTGFVVVRDGAASFCDASYVAPVAVTCQPIAEAASFASNYRVFGDVLNDDALVKWLEGAPFDTVGPH